MVLLTGASSSIGEATAVRLKNAGCVVYAAARGVERMNVLKDQGIHVLKLDLTDEASMTAAVESIVGEQGRIDILGNNAGYGSYGAGARPVLFMRKILPDRVYDRLMLGLMKLRG